MSKRGKVSKSKRKGLTTAQKRRGRIVSAIGRWNKKREKGSRLDRKQFWEVYREINEAFPNTTEAVKAVRQGRFALSGKSVKGKAGAKGPKRPIRNIGNTPDLLKVDFEWFMMREFLDDVNESSKKVKTTGKIVDWKKLGGYFLDSDVLIFKTSDVAGEDFVFLWKDLYPAYFALKGDTLLAQQIAPFTDKPLSLNFSKFSPQPVLKWSPKKSVIGQGVFVFDFALSGIKGKITGYKGKLREDEDDKPLPIEKPSEEIRKKNEERKQAKQEQEEKVDALEKENKALRERLEKLEKKEKEREAREERDRAKDRRAGKGRRKRTRKKRR